MPLRVVCVLQSRSRPIAWGTQTDPSPPELSSVTLHWTGTYGAAEQEWGRGKEGHDYH